MQANPDEIVVGGKQGQLVTNAQLRKQRVYGADLHACAAAAVAQRSGVYVVLPVGREQRQGGKPVNDVCVGTRTGEYLQQFLQDHTRGHEGFAAFKGLA